VPSRRRSSGEEQYRPGEVIGVGLAEEPGVVVLDQGRRPTLGDRDHRQAGDVTIDFNNPQPIGHVGRFVTTKLPQLAGKTCELTGNHE
jgi:hypothetical protein